MISLPSGRIGLLAALFAGLVIGGSHSARAGFVIDFNALAAGAIVNTQFSGVTISAVGGINQAVIFDTTNETGGDDDLVEPFGPGSPGATGFGNILIIQENGDSCNATSCSDPDDNAGGGSLIFDFANPVFLLSINIFDVEERGGTLELFDSTTTLLTTINIPVVGNRTVQNVSINQGGVSKLSVNLAGSGGVDDLQVVPEPNTLALFAFGLLALAGFQRRRKGAVLNGRI